MTGVGAGPVENAAPPLLSLAGITKTFPGVVANDAVDLRVMPGEIHALLGENGAGKSTLVKIIYGVLRADRGAMLWNGAPVAIAGPAAARDLGIGMVFQHFSLFEAMTVLENIALAMNDERNIARLRDRASAVAESYGLPLEPDRRVFSLSVGERQRIEVVRCLLQQPRLLVLDEPTSVLTPQEADRLFATLRQLAGEGCAVLYISHKLQEVRALCETATVLRDGKVVATCDPRRQSAERLAEMMIGAIPPAVTRSRAAVPATVRLAVTALSLPAADPLGVPLRSISLEVRSGEILGIAGVAGNGQTELMAALTGETLCAGPAATIRLDGHPVGHDGPAARRARGAGFVPEERNGHAAVADMTLADNAFLTAARRMGLAANGLIDVTGVRAFANAVITGFDVRTTGTDATAGSLSGGNLQKFVLGREILQDPGILVISQPTWGLDAGAAAAIRRALLGLADRGCAVLVISQDLDEIFELCDRIAVMSDGALSAARDIDAATVEDVGLLMGGLHDPAGPAPAGGRPVGRHD